MNYVTKDLIEALIIFVLFIVAIGWPILVTAALIKYVFGL